MKNNKKQKALLSMSTILFIRKFGILELQNRVTKLSYAKLRDTSNY